MITTEHEDRGLARNTATKDPLRVPPGTLPLLTTGCLATALALQALCVLIPALYPLLFPGLALAVIGLGAHACVGSGRIENGWAFLGLVPIVGLLLAYMALRFRQPQPNAPLNALRGAVHTALLGLILFSTGALMMISAQSGYELHGEVPDDFPVLAVVRANGGSFAAHIVPKRDLDAFERENPDLSYLVPKRLEASLHENLHYGSELPFQTASFEVRDISAGRQAFEVRYPIHSEAYSVGWYEATAQGVEPKRYLFFHDMMLGFLGLPLIAITAAIYSLLAWLLNRLLWPRFVSADD